MGQVIGVLYDAGDIIDKTLRAKVSIPVYDGVPTAGYFPNKIATIAAGQTAGTVYSYIDADPTNNRYGLWWVFYPGSVASSYYYMPHGEGYYDIDTLTEQGVLTVQQKNTEPDTWYMKLLKTALPVIALTWLGAAAIRGYLSRK